MFALGLRDELGDGEREHQLAEPPDPGTVDPLFRRRGAGRSIVESTRAAQRRKIVHDVERPAAIAAVAHREAGMRPPAIDADEA